MTDTVKCTVCGSSRLEHANRQHVFTTQLNDLRQRPSEQQEKVASAPPSVIATDIVLRLALVNAGVIGADDIITAETQLGLRPPAGEAGGAVADD